MPFLQIKSNKKFLLLLIISAAIFNFSFLEYNNYLIRKDNPGNIERNAASLAYGQTIYSVDNEYYTTPVENFLSGKGWKRGVGFSNGDYFRRVPGYSIVYLFFTAIFEKRYCSPFTEDFPAVFISGNYPGHSLSLFPGIRKTCQQNCHNNLCLSTIY